MTETILAESFEAAPQAPESRLVPTHENTAEDRPVLLTAEQEVKLAKQIEKGDLGAKETLIVSNLGLVGWISKKFPEIFPRDDLFQEGILGLIMAVERFDWRRGNKFSTYATPWIRKTILQAFEDKATIIDTPSNVSRDILTVDKALDKLSGRTAQAPKPEDIAATAKISLERVKIVLERGVVVASLQHQHQLKDGEGRELGDLRAAPYDAPYSAQYPTTEEEAMRNLAAYELETALQTLSAEDRIILEMRLMREEPAGWADIAQAIYGKRHRRQKELVRDRCAEIITKLQNFKEGSLREFIRT